jgi:hypothetical protein
MLLGLDFKKVTYMMEKPKRILDNFRNLIVIFQVQGVYKQFNLFIYKQYYRKKA